MPVVPTHPPTGALLISLRGVGEAPEKGGTGGAAPRYDSGVGGWEERGY